MQSGELRAPLPPKQVALVMTTDLIRCFFKVGHYCWRHCIILIAIVCCSASPGDTQSYYPDEFGNTWFLRSIDGIDERVVTIKAPEIVNGEAVRIVEDRTNDDISQFFTKVEPDGVKLFRSVAPLPLLEEATFGYLLKRDRLFARTQCYKG